MAGVGGGAAYIRLQVPKDDISANARNFAGIEAANARHQAGINEGKRKDAEAAKKKAYADTELPDDAFKNDVTGFDNIDDINRDFASSGVDLYIDLGRQAREAYDKGDNATYRNLVQKQKKILNSFDNHTNDQKMLGKLNADYMKLDTEGKISPVDEEWEKVMDAANSNNYKYVYDEDGNVNMKFLLKDEDGNEYTKTVKKSDFFNGNYRPYEKVEVTGNGGLIDDMLVGFGKRVYDKQSGNYITTKQVWDDKNEAGLQAKLEEVTSSDRSMSSLLYQATGGAVKKKGNPKVYGEESAFTDEDYKIVRQFITDQVKAQYNEEEKLRQDSTNLGWANLAQRKREANKPKPKSKDEEKFSIRKYDIRQAIENNDVQAFASGDFEWQGKKYTAQDAIVTDGKIIITAKSGNKTTKISIDKDERALNDLFNAFGGKDNTYSYDNVMGVEENKYRDLRVGSEVSVDAVVDELFDEDGNARVDDEDFMKSIKEAFGAEVEDNFTWSGNSLKVNGKSVDTSNREVFRKTLTEALKKSYEKVNTTGASKESDPLGIF